MGRKSNSNRAGRGFTLVELLVTIAVLGLILTGIVGVISQIQRIARDNLGRSTALAIAREHIEVARNVPYSSVGTSTSFPSGPLPATFTTVRNAITFYGTIAINAVDDPADLLACDPPTNNPPPCDTAPADYRKVEVRVCIDTANCGSPIRLTTFIVPNGVESADTAGSLFVTVVDAGGQPVPLVDITVTNPGVLSNPIVNRTDINGKLQLLSLPPANNSYNIALTKSGYTDAGTVAASAGNPNPVQPPVSVVLGDVTSTTFVMDRVSTLTVLAKDVSSCSANPSLNMHLRGQRLIGTSPDVYLVDQDITLDGNGQHIFSNLPWDDYQLTLLSSSYDTSGMSPPDTIQVNPGTNVTSSLITSPHQSDTLRVTVKTVGTEAPIAGATVRLTNGSGYDQTLVTDQGTISQTDWSGGPGQTTIGLPDRFATQSGAPKTSVAGQVSIDSALTNHSADEDFSDTNHRDGGLTTTKWNPVVSLADDPFNPGQFLASGQAQSTSYSNPLGAIINATLTVSETIPAGTSISYFLSADGLNFEPVAPGTSHTFANVGQDLRWRAELASSDVLATPTLTSVSISYNQDERPISTATITSSSFDSGASTNYLTLSWSPSTQPPLTGTNSLKFQVAANNDNATWNYVGPDDTSGSYFTTSGGSIPASVSGKQYFRYRAFLTTASPMSTPTLGEVTVIKNNACTPPGQSFFSPLTPDNYTLDVSASGFTPSSTNVTVNGQTAVVVTLTPS